MRQCVVCEEEKHFNQFKKGEAVCRKCTKTETVEVEVKTHCDCGNNLDTFSERCNPCELAHRGCPTPDVPQYRCFLSSAMLYVTEDLYFHEGKAYTARFKPFIDSGIRQGTFKSMIAKNEDTEVRPCIYSKVNYDLETILIGSVEIPINKEVNKAKATLSHQEFKRALERVKV